MKLLWHVWNACDMNIFANVYIWAASLIQPASSCASCCFHCYARRIDYITVYNGDMTSARLNRSTLRNLADIHDYLECFHDTFCQPAPMPWLRYSMKTHFSTNMELSALPVATLRLNQACINTQYSEFQSWGFLPICTITCNIYC